MVKGRDFAVMVKGRDLAVVVVGVGLVLEPSAAPLADSYIRVIQC